MHLLLKEEFTEGIFWPYLRWENQIIKLLEEIMDDKETNWISYYCYEKDYGRDKKLNVKDKDNNIIPLATAEDLWDLLTNR